MENKELPLKALKLYCLFSTYERNCHKIKYLFDVEKLVARFILLNIYLDANFETVLFFSERYTHKILFFWPNGYLN